MKATVSTREAATLLGIDPRRVAGWARTRDLRPVRRQRIGRSWVTVWSVADIRKAQERRYAGQTTGRGGEMSTLSAECPPSEVA